MFAFKKRALAEKVVTMTKPGFVKGVYYNTRTGVSDPFTHMEAAHLMPQDFFAESLFIGLPMADFSEAFQKREARQEVRFLTASILAFTVLFCHTRSVSFLLYAVTRSLVTHTTAASAAAPKGSEPELPELVRRACPP